MSDIPNEADLIRETQAIWETNARWWDEQMGEGNAFQQYLIGPATERLLQVQPDQHILDLACGNGVFSRRLAALGARVLACDFSPAFLERAKARTIEHADRVEYRLVDLTDAQQPRTLGAQRFDAAVCSMALMDMVTITPLLQSLAVLLKPGGHFVFSVLHPCFNNAGCTLLVEQHDHEGELRTTHAVKVTRYLSFSPVKGLGIVGQPTPHYYFHRSLTTLFHTCFEVGFVLNGLEEPAFVEPRTNDLLRWDHFQEIPPVLVARLQLLPRPTAT